MLHISSENSLEYNLQLSYEMRQSLEILSLSVEDLWIYLREIALENPVIDLDTFSFTEEDLDKRKKDWLKQQENPIQFQKIFRDDFEYNKEDQFISSTEMTLRDYLIEQIQLNTSKKYKKITMYLAYLLDDNGYFSLSYEELKKLTFGQISSTELTNAIMELQSLEPRGIGSFTLSQCLLLQLSEENLLEQQIITYDLNLVAKSQYQKIAAALGVSKEKVEKACDIIRKLNPKPGSSFSSSTEKPLYIIPDVLVYQWEGQIKVLPCDFAYPQIHLIAEIENLYQKSNEKEKVYLQEKEKEVKIITNSLKERSHTLMQVTQEIVKQQSTFFMLGEKSLKPLRLADIADILHIHESTVSRTVKDKYLQCTYGIFPLKYFFTGEVASDSTENYSAQQVKYKIVEYIQCEEKNQPLSDQKIVELLKGEGIQVARRTVTKYREEFGILSSQYRRK